ncbi:MAG: hypothetical protein IJQ43_02335 [Oscillospiraceae bacterium]|nr:hypothetical protein [Oscillospiraceae bacterium]
MLLPIVALLVVALVAVAMLYLRTSAEAPLSPVETQAPAVPAVSASYTPKSVATPRPAPFVEPMELYLDLDTEPEALDVVVCDSEGVAVPGYAFPLEIRYQDGSSYQVLSDVNGRYYAAYIPSGRYTVSMLPMEGFIPAAEASCTVEPDYDKDTVGNIGSFVGKGSDGRQSEERTFRYRYSVGEHGFLLYADGTESDVLPVEERGDLAYGVRMVTVYHLPDGTDVEPEELPADAVRWTDYYTDEKSVTVPLILREGVVDERFSITAERIDPSAERRSGWVEENGRSYYYAADGRPLSGLQNIEGKLYFFDGSGAKASSLGIDVSYHNSAIDWNAVKAAGIDFAIIRVGYRTWEKGVLNEDPDSYRQGKNGGFYLQGAKAAGLKVGVYVYSTAINADEGVEEAQLALDIVRKSGVELDLPIYFDTEFSSVSPRGRSDKLNYIQRAQIAKAFCETVEEAGLRAGVYSYQDFFNRALRLQDVNKYDIWYASYTRGYTLPAYRGFAIWQFTESGRVNGMPDEVDMNVIF